MDLQRFSTLSTLLRSTAWVNRFLHNARSLSLRQDGPLQACEIDTAQTLWNKFVQHHAYHQVLHCLASNRHHPLIRQLDLFLSDNGLLRCGGRLKHADLPVTATHPILLPSKDPYTDLVIRHYHQKLHHAGTAHTLSYLRQWYWIPSGRQQVTTIIQHCPVCRQGEGLPFAVPPMPDLPSERVTKSPPFSYTGIDYLGPLFCSDVPGDRKVWVCLFTCLAVRALHLELVLDMTSEQFLLALRRFISRRGTPTELLSDNAPQFHTVNSALQQLWYNVTVDTSVHHYTAQEGISWRFIPAHAPWMGGVYERLVGLVKRALRKTLLRTRLTTEQLRTLLTEVEATINTRPLLYVASDDTTRTLSPADFPHAHTSLALPPPDEDTATADHDHDYQPPENTSVAHQLLVSWKKGQHLLNSFWKLWKTDYLTGLRESHRHFRSSSQRTAQLDPRLGDIVQIHDSTPRATWKIGTIIALLSSRDGHVRTADVCLPNHHTVRRPVSALYLLEISPNVHSTISPPVTTPANLDHDPQLPGTSRRSTRAAAQRANERLQDAALY